MGGVFSDCGDACKVGSLPPFGCWLEQWADGGRAVVIKGRCLGGALCLVGLMVVLSVVMLFDVRGWGLGREDREDRALDLVTGAERRVMAVLDGRWKGKSA